MFQLFGEQVKPGFTNYQPRGLAIWNYKNKNSFNNFQQISFANNFSKSDFLENMVIKFCNDMILINDQNGVFKAKKVKVG